LGVGGAEILALNQAKCLQSLGYDVRVVTCAVDMSRWQNQFDGMRLELIGAYDRLDWLGGREIWLARRARRLSPALAGVDVAIAHNYPMSRVLGTAATKARKIWYCNEPNREIHLIAANPTLAANVESGTHLSTDAVRFHLESRQRQRDPIPGINHKLVWERNRDLASIDRLDVLCANSGYARELAIRTYGPRPFKVLYPVVRFPDRGTSRTGLDRNELRILVHTRLEPAKNVDTVLRGFAQFLATGRHRARLHIVGEGTSRERLQLLSAEIGIEESVTFHGFVSELELRQIYDDCEVFALLPVDEPFGMVFPEAAARGLLLVGPDHGGPFEIMENGRLGITSNVFSPDQLASAFERLLSLSDHEVDALRADADASCRNRFSAEAIGPQMIAAYELK
jgi:glycosyltransferase involved in cell wall biosynthesis